MKIDIQRLDKPSDQINIEIMGEMAYDSSQTA